MTFQDIIAIANSAYPDSLIDQADQNRDDDGNIHDVGDTLAIFIVRELEDIYDDQESDIDKLQSAGDALNVARMELDSVIAAFKRELQSRTGA